MRSVAGGFLAQTRDNGQIKPESLRVVTKRAPSAQEMEDLMFAFRVAKHVKSNAIVYTKNNATVGIGAGQMSRVDSARIAASKSGEAAKLPGWMPRSRRGLSRRLMRFSRLLMVWRPLWLRVPRPLFSRVAPSGMMR